MQEEYRPAAGRADETDIQQTRAAPHQRCAIVTAGKAHYDLMEVLRRLDISLDTLAAHGVRIYKLGLTYPIEPTRMPVGVDIPLHPGAERYYREHGYLRTTP